MVGRTAETGSRGDDRGRDVLETAHVHAEDATAESLRAWRELGLGRCGADAPERGAHRVHAPRRPRSGA